MPHLQSLIPHLRSFVPHLQFLILLAILGKPCVAGEPRTAVERGAAKWITPGAERAVAKGLAYLAAQQREDGSMGRDEYRGNVAVVSLAGMAMMADGSGPGRGPFGRHISRGLDYVVAQSRESGLLLGRGVEDRRPMYGHGFGTLFLAECYGSSPNKDVREKLSKAVRLILNTQNSQGGWRYWPERADADISVTVCQVMALRAARNAGIHVPAEAIQRAADYIKRSQNPDGGFMYMLEPPGPSAFPRSAAAVVGLFCAGIYQGDEVTKGLGYVAQFQPRSGAAPPESPHTMYGQYYATMAMWQAGGERWAGWYPAVRDRLIATQQPSGAWSASAISSEADAAMACLILQVPNNYLPIFQR